MSLPSTRMVATFALYISRGYTIDPVLDIPRPPLLALPAPEGDPCDECGHYHGTDDIITDDFGSHCQECHDELFWTCDACDGQFDLSVEVPDANHHCQDCHDERHFTCTGCGDEFRIDGSRWNPDTRRHDDDGNAYCESCYDDTFFYCEGCHSECRQDDYGSDGRCVECSGPEGIQDSCANAASQLGFLGAESECFGIELEVEVNDSRDRGDLAESVRDTLGNDYVIIKEDGSLSYGFEIVTAPATPDIHTERWVDFLGNKQNTRGLTSFDNHSCGMHVHVSRSMISPLTLGKILVFINSPDNAKPISALAGRDITTCQWCAAKDVKVTSGKNNGWNKYDAVNTSKRATIEFRIFKGTLALDGFMKNFEFVRATVAFCKYSGARNLAWSDFVAWLEQAPKVYPYLVKWMRSKGYMQSVRFRPIPLVLAEPILN